MKLPNVVSAGFLAIVLFALQWFSGHLGEFSIPPAYGPIIAGLVGVAITAVAKLVQESSAKSKVAATRGLGDEPTPSLAARVLFK